MAQYSAVSLNGPPHGHASTVVPWRGSMSRAARAAALSGTCFRVGVLREGHGRQVEIWRQVAPPEPEQFALPQPGMDGQHDRGHEPGCGHVAGGGGEQRGQLGLLKVAGPYVVDPEPPDVARRVHVEQARGGAGNATVGRQLRVHCDANSAEAVLEVFQWGMTPSNRRSCWRSPNRRRRR